MFTLLQCVKWEADILSGLDRILDQGVCLAAGAAAGAAAAVEVGDIPAVGATVGAGTYSNMLDTVFYFDIMLM